MFRLARRLGLFLRLGLVGLLGRLLVLGLVGLLGRLLRLGLVGLLGRLLVLGLVGLLGLFLRLDLFVLLLDFAAFARLALLLFLVFFGPNVLARCLLLERLLLVFALRRAGAVRRCLMGLDGLRVARRELCAMTTAGRLVGRTLRGLIGGVGFERRAREAVGLAEPRGPWLGLRDLGLDGFERASLAVHLSLNHARRSGFRDGLVAALRRARTG